jgi:hypothetical protein
MYICPMHPEIRQEGPGKCPKCGMVLVPEGSEKATPKPVMEDRGLGPITWKSYLKGFAEGYSTYDLLAQKWMGYGYIYPFLELAFGLLMLAGIHNPALLWVELLVMLFSGLGVAIKIARKEEFLCACLGTFLKVPLTKITLIEDFGMAALAGLLLILI